jgi:phenylacetic acid degradation operon negative regulatory protein
MMRVLKKKLLFALASEVDFFLRAEGYEYKPYEFLYFRLSEFEKGSVRDAAVRLSRGGAVDRITRNGQAQFRLTGVGREKLLKSLAISRGQKRVWDRIWRTVVVEGLGEDLRLLQRKLRALGYRRVARGVYITPLAVSDKTKELLMEKTWTNKVFVIESRRLIVGDDWQLARRLWDLDKQAGKYADFVRQAESLLKKARRNLVVLQQSNAGFKQVFDRYFWLLFSDPGLPRKLLPDDWQAEKAKELFLRLVELTKTAGI